MQEHGATHSLIHRYVVIGLLCQWQLYLFCSSSSSMVSCLSFSSCWRCRFSRWYWAVLLAKSSSCSFIRLLTSPSFTAAFVLYTLVDSSNGTVIVVHCCAKEACWYDNKLQACGLPDRKHSPSLKIQGMIRYFFLFACQL